MDAPIPQRSLESTAYPDRASARLRRAVNRTDDPKELKGMLLYIANSLEQDEEAGDFYPRAGWLCPGPPCIL